MAKKVFFDPGMAQHAVSYEIWGRRSGEAHWKRYARARTKKDAEEVLVGEREMSDVTRGMEWRTYLVRVGTTRQLV